LVASTFGRARVRPGEGPIELPEQLVLRGRPQPHPTDPVRRPCRELTEHQRAVTDRLTTTCEQQLGHRLKVDRVGLDGAFAQHPSLLGDMAGIELQDLPTGWPRPGRQQWPVVVPSSLDTDLHHRIDRERPLDIPDDLGQRRASHRATGPRL
jgi:hypothetical protein